MQRRLTTVMAADIVGYSSQTRADENDTLRRLSDLRRMVEAHVVSFDGRPISWAGDGFLAEFSSPIAAVRAGFELQRELAAPVNQKAIAFQMRIGLHLAEVVVHGNDLLGDGVNVASRIEAMAEPGAVCLSRPVFDQVKRGAQLTFHPHGAQQLKGIDEPVEIFSVLGDLSNHSCTTSMDPAGRLESFPTREMPANAVLVLPFENVSSDPEQDYLADGFTDDIITELSRFGELLVISRNASFGLRNSARDLSEICPRLGARFCLEGGIRKMGRRIRITCHLVGRPNRKTGLERTN